MSADVIDYQIIGDDLQAIIITLDPAEAVVGEAGAMMYLEDGVEMATQLSMKKDAGGLMGRLFEAGKRVITGESFFITMFVNESSQRRDCAFAAPYPGHVVPIELENHGGELLCQKDSFLCAAYGIEVDIAFTKRFGAGLFGGEGFILQRLKSPDGRGQAFCHAGGTVLQRSLGPGERLKVDTGCIVAFESSIDYSIQLVKGIKNKLFGGEGFFYAVLEGPGTVWLQTLPFSRLANRVIAAAPSRGGKRVGEGSVLGGVFDMIDGS
ncbi:MAG: TIGR00266 family protein [Planctomycetota bacterium]|nr:MAG: TIGR00266 family protein [Planctomycetota bacterium]